MGFSDDAYNKVTLSQLKRMTHLSNEDQAVYDIHDILKAYYKVALKRFTDSAVLQVVERCYFSLDGPVMLITPEYIENFQIRTWTKSLVRRTKLQEPGMTTTCGFSGLNKLWRLLKQNQREM